MKNSKEALERLMVMTDDDTYELEEVVKVSEIIARDLEVLDILKKIVSIKDYNSTGCPPFIILSGGEVKDIKEAKKIKEWLEK